MNIIIKPKKIFCTLLIIILFLEIASIVGFVVNLNDDNSKPIFNLFNIGIEGNFPAYYSTITILFASFLLALIALFRKKTGLSYSLWLVLSIIFLYLSIDESVQLHEKLGAVFDRHFNLTGYFSWGWVVPYGIIFIIFSIVYYFKFLPQLPKKIYWLFIISGAIYVMGAIGFEMIGAKNFHSANYSKILDFTFYSIEEFLEMLGIALFIYSLLLYIEDEIVITLKKQTNS
jgi:hypothetical protein